jgi:hypothetical protein
MYEVINAALNAVLLDGRYEARPLYLVLDNAARRELAAILGCSDDEVEATCCAEVGRSLRPAGDPYLDHQLRMRIWQLDDTNPKPPMTALLYTLAHAAELMGNSGEYTSGNYYNRLAQVTGVAASRLSQFGSSTPKFWTAFSNWLSETDYQYGQPTARPLNAFVYVSLAMSQAVVRAAERECFHHLFQKYRFSSTDTLTEDEMAHYIGSWIHSSGANQRLRAAWQKPELRPRIAEVALAELEQWTEITTGDQPDGARGAVGLSLAAAVIPDFPARKLALSIGRRGEVESDVLLRAEDPANTSSFVLGNSTYGTFASIAPVSAADMNEVLECGAGFDAVDGSCSFSWHPRPIIPFSRSDSGPYWTEVNRTNIGAEHMVLVRNSRTRLEQVDALLAEVAAPGYTAATSEHLLGLPSGWTLYENVRLLRVPSEGSTQLAALSPVSDRPSLQLVGGLPLSRGIWHRDKPPLLHLEAAGGVARIDLTQGIEGTGELLARVEDADSAVDLPISQDLVPEDGLLAAEALIGGVSVARNTILLRSAERPRPLDRQAGGRLAYRDITTADPSDDVSEAEVHVEGTFVHGEHDVSLLADLPAGFEVLGTSGELEQDAPLVGKESSSTVPRVRSDDPLKIKALGCQKTGIHVWVYETMPPGYPASKPAAAECSTCGLAILTRNRGQVAPRGNRPRAPIPPPPAPVARQAAPETIIDLDLVLDALCFIGNGSSGSFEALVAADLEQPWEAREVARKLVALGHVDIARKVGSGRIASWSVPPATMAFIGEADAVLTGFRCNTLVDRVREIAEAAGGSLEAEEHAGQPRRLLLRGIPGGAGAELFASTADPLGRAIRVLENAPLRLATACASMRDLGRLLRPISIGRPDYLQSFELRTGRWRNCEAITVPGAYRFQHAGQTYAYRGPDGATLEGPHELVKLLAARDAGINLHAYSATDRVFTSVLGCEPPGLLRRALVACTGKLPSRSAGVVTYADVPAEIATTVLRTLYPRDQA